MVEYKHGPLPIPDIEGEAAVEFLKEISKPPTESQKRMIEEGRLAYKTIKRRD